MPTDSTRTRLLDRLKTAGPQTVAVLAEHLAMTDVAVRQHLALLQDDGLVRDGPAESRGGPGRPARVWLLTEAGHRGYPDRHNELTGSLIAAIRRAVGERGLRQVVEVRAGDQRIEYRRAIPEDLPLEQRLRTLAERRTAEGYMAEVRREGDGSYLLIEHHCPICDAAKACQGFCAAELDLFRELLPDARVERTEHLLSEGRRCVYSVRSR